MTVKASVIIPAYNRCSMLEKCLASLSDQTVPVSEYEVIVIDDGSTDDTEEMLKKIQANNLIVLSQENSGRSKARNLGIRNAEGDIIIFIDSDVIVNKQFVESHIKTQEKEKGIFARGMIIQIPGTEHLKKPGLFAGMSSASFPTTNCSIRKEYLYMAGLFDEDFTQYGWEDLELGSRLRAMGMRKVKVPKAVVYHLKPQLCYEMLRDEILKEQERGRMAAVYCRKNPVFRTYLSTLYIPPFISLYGYILRKNRSVHQKLRKTLKWLEQKRFCVIFKFVAGIVLLAAYFKGMQEAHEAEDRCI